MVFRGWISAAWALAGALVLAAHGASASGVVPYRALYDISLKTAAALSGIETVRGELVIDLQEACDGWTLDEKMALQVMPLQGGELKILSSTRNWESRDGRDYRFASRLVSPGDVEERRAGAAHRAGRGEPGEATFVSPKPGRMPLPRGFMFPVEHTRELVAAAGTAPTTLSRVVFDGSSMNGLMEYNILIGKPQPAEAEEASAANPLRPLAGQRSWRVHGAAFDATATGPTPEFELGMRMYENGIGDEIVLDLGAFSVTARLSGLSLGARPACAASR